MYQFVILMAPQTLPSEFGSRNASLCNQPRCQICKFASQLEESVVQLISVKDILSGSVCLPFKTQSTWLSVQSECISRTHAHLKQGTHLSKKVLDAKDIKHHLHAATISQDGLLILCCEDPFASACECIIVP